MHIEEPIHPEIIKAHLRIRFGTLEKFEKAKGLPLRSVSQVLIGKSLRRAASAIADELDIPLHRVSARYFNQSTTVTHRAKIARKQRLNAGAK